MTNGHQHNLSVAWVRMWGAVGSTYLADSLVGDRQHTARELADFEARRFSTACYALGTTAALL